MNETMMTTEAATPTEGEGASNPDTQAATGAAEGVQQQAAEGQPAQGEQSTESQQTEAKPQIPENYEFTVPEGVTVLDGAKEAYAEVAKELGLTQEQAQKAFEKLSSKGVEAQRAQLETMTKQWADQSTADPEFGGEKLQESLVVSRKALDSFGTPELRNLLNESGLGNHPELIRFMYRAGKAISEDKFIAGRSGQAQAKDPAEVLFGKQ